MLVLSVIMLSGCAINNNVQQCVTGETYGFWAGLWHGIIAPIDFIVSLFNDKYTVFAQNNNGHWYTFGFIVGSGGWGFLGFDRVASSQKAKNKKQLCCKEEKSTEEDQ